jgi:hypothetical protein
MALCAEVIDFIRPNRQQQSNQIGGVVQVAKMQEKPRTSVVEVRKDAVDPLCIEATGAALDSMNLIPL